MNITPAPWNVEKDYSQYGRYCIIKAAYEQSDWIEGGYDISEEEGDLRSKEAHTRDENNRQLIQAAPDLLRGCQAALAYLVDPPSPFSANRLAGIEIIRHAIFKAEGRE